MEGTRGRRVCGPIRTASQVNGNDKIDRLCRRNRRVRVLESQRELPLGGHRDPGRVGERPHARSIALTRSHEPQERLYCSAVGMVVKMGGESVELMDLFVITANCGGEGGIRTHVPFRTRRFRGAPVTTTSVPLRYLLRSVGPLLRSPPRCALAALRRLPFGARLPTRSVREWCAWGPFYIPHLAARSRSFGLPFGARLPTRSAREWCAWGPFYIPHLAVRSRPFGLPFGSRLPTRCAREWCAWNAVTATSEPRVANCELRTSKTYRRSSKNPWIIARHSASSTPPTASIR